MLPKKREYRFYALIGMVIIVTISITFFLGIYNIFSNLYSNEPDIINCTSSFSFKTFKRTSKSSNNGKFICNIQNDHSDKEKNIVLLSSLLTFYFSIILIIQWLYFVVYLKNKEIITTNENYESGLLRFLN